MGVIKLTGLEIFAHHGVLESEKKNGQRFLVDITIISDFSEAAKNDDLEKTVNYADLTDYVNQIFDEVQFDLIESVVCRLAEKIILRYKLIEEISVTVHKPSAPLDAVFSDVSVTAGRKRHMAYIAVGSNLGDSEEIIRLGKDDLFSDKRVVLLRESELIRTKPYGVTDQPDFLNGMWVVETILEPNELLDRLHEVEAGQKRERIIHWGPRTLDLDIIYFDDYVISTQNLTVPHIDMENRSFVLEPLKQVDPFIRHPINKMTASQMLERL